MHIDFGYGCYDGGVDYDEIPHGRGVITYYKENTKIPDGTVESDFVHGVMVGDAIVKYNDGGVYVGKYDKSEGFRVEHGVMTYPDGDKYDGEWKNNQRNGKGTITFATGGRYVGGWKDDKMHGYGEYYYANGNIYL